MEHLSLNIFTLNCWGLLGVSKYRSKRIKAIANHLNEQDYDIVFLQEIWVESDFKYIHETTKNKLPYAYSFKNSSLVGKPGLAIISKYSPSTVHFERFITNGSPFRFWHGDWFTGKGVGYALIRIQNYNFHLFCSHMHAQYNSHEKLDDQYSIHRLCQSFQMANFINLITSFSKSKRYADKDVIILAGDLNVSPDDLPYKLLLAMTGLHDSCQVYQHQQINSKTFDRHFDFTTCGHPFNTFTPSNTDYVKRIDYIFYRLISNESCLQSNRFHFLKHHPCLIDRIECSTKCAVSGLSFSDHQPVAIRLSIHHSGLTTDQTNKSQSSNQIEEDSQDSNSQDSSTFSENKSRSDSNSECEMLQLEIEDHSNEMLSNRKNRKITEEQSIKIDSRGLQETSMCKEEIKKQISDQELQDLNQIYSNEQFYLQNLQNLIWSYKQSANRKTRILFWILSIAILFSIVYTINVHFEKWKVKSIHAVDLWSLLLASLLTFVLFINLLDHRFEMNAIDWILDEVEIKIKADD